MKNFWLERKGPRKLKINIYMSRDVAFHFRDREEYPVLGDMPEPDAKLGAIANVFGGALPGQVDKEEHPVYLLETVEVPLPEPTNVFYSSGRSPGIANMVSDTLNKHFLNFWCQGVIRAHGEKGCGPQEKDFAQGGAAKLGHYYSDKDPNKNESMAQHWLRMAYLNNLDDYNKRYNRERTT